MPGLHGPPEHVLAWADTLASPCVLNVAGPRASEWPEGYDVARALLEELLRTGRPAPDGTQGRACDPAGVTRAGSGAWWSEVGRVSERRVEPCVRLVGLIGIPGSGQARPVARLPVWSRR